MQLLDIIPKGISDEDMSQLIMDWNLSDKAQQEAIEMLFQSNIKCYWMHPLS